jgi:tetratricopeptide (TPR) repeat protein
MNSQKVNLSTPNILGGIGGIFLILGLGPVGIILILIAFHQYSQMLNKPSIFKDGLTWGISSFVAIILFIFSIAISPIFLFAYGVLIFAVINLKKALTELSITLNQNLFDMSGKFIFWGALLSIILIGLVGIFIGNILLTIAFFTAPKEIQLEITHSRPESTNSQPEIDACSNFLKAGDYKKAIEFGKLALQKYPENPAAYYCLGEAYYKVGELNLAYVNMKKAESLTNNKDDLMHIYNRIGLILLSLGNLDDAILYFMKSLISAKELNNIDMQASILNNIANVYNSKGELDKALSYYEESLNLQTNEKDKAVTYNNIANIYSGKGDYQKAIEYFQKAIELDEKYGDYHNASIHKLNLGDTYRQTKDYENAEKYLSEGLEGVKNVGDKFWEAYGYWYFGRLYGDKGDKKTAREYYTRAYNLFKSIGAEVVAQSVLNEMDILY